MTLPINKKYAPMEALPATDLPEGPEWQYEPKWDGFRCLAFRDEKHVDLQSKSGKPLTRYFPDLAATLLALKAKKFVLDGEIVIPVDGHLSFDELLVRIHPAASRVLKLSQEHPSVFIVFDLLVDEKGKSLVKLPLEKRRQQLERFARMFVDKNASISVSPVTDDFSSSIQADERLALTKKLEKMIKAPGFTGKAPGGLSRWSTKHSMEWQPLDPKLVAEVQFDHFTGGRFRHGTKFLRWRPEKAPRDCTMKQVKRENKSALNLL